MSNADYQIFEDIIQEMMMVYRHDNRPWLIGYSGGKDSTLLVSLVFRAVSIFLILLNAKFPPKESKIRYFPRYNQPEGHHP